MPYKRRQTEAVGGFMTKADIFGDEFQHGGIEGLIQQGWFGSVMTPSVGARLKFTFELLEPHYVQAKDIPGCEDLTVWVNRAHEPSVP